MSSNTYLINAKSKNIKAKYNGEKVVIAKAVFYTKVIYNEKIPDKLIQVALNNKAPYYIELLGAKDNVEKELVFIRKENQASSSEGMDSTSVAIGYLVKGEIVPSIQATVQKGSVGSNGKHIDYNSYIEYFNGAAQFYMNGSLVFTRGVIPEVSKD